MDYRGIEPRWCWLGDADEAHWVAETLPEDFDLKRFALDV